MKYIDAEKLIAEIEFAKSVYDNPKRVIHGVADAFRQDGRAAMCDDILKKITSLQQEQPETDLLEEEYMRGFAQGAKEERKDLAPLINRLCEAILFEWKDAADLARKTLTQIKAREE